MKNALLPIVGLVSFFLSAAAGAAERTARLDQIQGDVQVAGNGASFRPAQPGQELSAGAVVRTDAEARALAKGG